MKGKLLFYLLVLPVLLLVAIISYYLYGSYVDYNNAKESKASIVNTKNIGKFLVSLTKEMDSSSIYFASKGALHKQELQRDRKRTNISLAQIISVSKDNFITSNIRQYKQDLISVRSTIDTLAGDYESVIGIAFQKNIIDPTLKTLHSLKLTQDDNKVQTFTKLLSTLTNIAGEKAFLEYYTISKSRINYTALPLLESYVSKDIFPKINFVFGNSLDDKIRNLLTISPNDAKLLDDIRAEIFAHSINGAYSLNESNIVKLYDLLEDKVKQSISIVSENIGLTLQGDIDRLQNRLYQYAVALAILLMVFIFLLKILLSNTKEKKELEKVLKEMVRDLDEERQKELNTIIKKGDTVAIYHFLAETIQDANEAKEEAIEAEKAKDLFLANMSHEIRTPLNGILGFTQLLQGTEPNSEQKEFLQVISTSSNNLLKIVNDILDLSKIKVDKMDLEKIEFDATEVLVEALEPHETKASDKKIEYTTFIDPYLPNLIGDPVKLSQVMTNLIGNAMKFTDYNGSVKVSIVKTDESEKDVAVRFSVKDDGIGVSAEQIERIFQPFSQADISTTRKFGGTGLGLTITKTLIEKMGGELILESEVGKGSEFYFTLRFKKASPAIKYDEIYSKLFIGYYKPADTPTRTVDINLKKYLEATGAEYEEFDNLDKDITKRYDIVFADYSHAKTRDNIDLLFELSNYLIVMMYISYNEDAKSIQDKVDSVIYKPLNMLKIVRSIDKVIDEDISENSKQDIVEPSSDADKISLSGANILVAEDNNINQKLIKSVFDEMGINTTIANNGQEAVELYRDNSYDLVFMDIQMPILSGVDATHEIINLEKKQNRAHTPIIALTANAIRGDREKYLEAGMDDYISKPIVLEELKKIMKQYCKPKEIVVSNEVDENISKQQELDSAVVNNKELVLDESGETKEQKTSQEGADTKSSNNILVYSKNSAVCKIHKSVLSHLDKETDYALDLETFIESADNKEYSYVLVSSNLIDEDLCIILESMSEIGITPLIYGDANCSNGDFKNYKNFDELKELLN